MASIITCIMGMFSRCRSEPLAEGLRFVLALDAEPQPCVQPAAKHAEECEWKEVETESKA